MTHDAKSQRMWLGGGDAINAAFQQALLSDNVEDHEAVRRSFEEYLAVHAKERKIGFPAAPLAVKDEPPMFVAHNIPFYRSDMHGDEDYRLIVCNRLDAV